MTVRTWERVIGAWGKRNHRSESSSRQMSKRRGKPCQDQLESESGERGERLSEGRRVLKKGAKPGHPSTAKKKSCQPSSTGQKRHKGEGEQRKVP